MSYILVALLQQYLVSCSPLRVDPLDPQQPSHSMTCLYCSDEPMMMEVIGPFSLQQVHHHAAQHNATQRNATQRNAYAAQGTQRMAFKQDTTHHNSSQPTQLINQSINNIASVPLLAGMMHLPITRSTTSPVPFSSVLTNNTVTFPCSRPLFAHQFT